MAYTPNAVVLEGFPFGIFTFTYEMSGVAQTDEAAAATLGMPVTLDTANPGTFKVCGAGDPIHGRVYTCENRAVEGMVTAAIARKFKERLPAGNGHGISVGDRIEGAADGLVATAVAPDNTMPLVIATGDDYVIAEYL